jgi:hypothetical protein
MGVGKGAGVINLPLPGFLGEIKIQKRRNYTGDYYQQLQLPF